MKIDINAINKYLPFYVSAIVGATMKTCEAAALGRGLTAGEVAEMADEVARGSLDFMRGYKDELMAQGEAISDEEFNRLRQDIYDGVFNNAWAMIQGATEELKKRTGENENR